MPNGIAWGGPELWDRLEGPLRRLDSGLAAFAHDHGMTLTRNTYRGNWPERALSWINDFHGYISISLHEADEPLYDFTFGAGDRRDGVFVRKVRTVVERVPIEVIEDGFRTRLQDAYAELETWTTADLEPLPPSGPGDSVSTERRSPRQPVYFCQGCSKAISPYLSHCPHCQTPVPPPPSFLPPPVPGTEGCT
jgi:hypothetical protein